MNITDGRYVYMHAPVSTANEPLYEYTLMPCHMNAPYWVSELKGMTLTDEFAYTKGAQVLKVKSRSPFNAYYYGTMLFDLETDAHQEKPIENPREQLRLRNLMRLMMKENQAPKEQYQRLGIPEDGDIKEEWLVHYDKQKLEAFTDGHNLTKS